MLPLPDGVWSLIERHLATSRPPGDGAAHFDTYGPQGWLIVDRNAAAVADTDREAYGRRRSAIPLRGLSLVPVTPLDWRSDAEGGTLLAEVQDDGTAERFRAAFRLSGPPWGVMGAYLEAGDLPEPAVVKSRVLAEVAAWSPRPHDGVWPMTTLQAAVLRVRPSPAEPLLILPESRFTCQGSQHCCRSGDWGIPMGANAVRALTAMPWADLPGEAPGTGDYAPDDAMPSALKRAFPQKLLADETGNCLACSEQGCSVHAAAGWQPLAVCALFPYVFTETPEGLAVTLSYSCPTVAANVGQPVRDQETDLRRRLQPVRHVMERVQEPVRLVPDGGRLAWATFRRLEMAMLDWLADERLGTVPERLQAGHGRLAALMAAQRGDGFLTDAVLDAWLAADWPALQPSNDLHAADALMASLLTDGPIRPEVMLGGGRPEVWHMAQGRALDGRRDEALLMRYLRQVLFRKRGLAAGVAFQWGVLAWIVRVFERDVQWRADQAGQAIDTAIQTASIGAIDRALLNADMLSRMVRVPGLVARLSSPVVWASLATI